MTLLHDAYTALLSGLTHKTGNEIHWHDEDGYPITVEPIDVDAETYVVRHYRESNGDLYWEGRYQKKQLHGKSTGWHPNGQKYWEEGYRQGQLHESIEWGEDGTLMCELYYINGYWVTPEKLGKHNDTTT